MAALDLARLARLTFHEKWTDALEKLFSMFSADIEQHPSAHTQMLIGFDFMIGPSQEIIIAKATAGLDERQVLGIVDDYFLPNKAILLLGHDKDLNGISKIAPLTVRQRPISGQTTIYICEQGVCKLPVTGEKELRALLLPMASTDYVNIKLKTSEEHYEGL